MSESHSGNSDLSKGKSIIEYPICYCGMKAYQRTEHTEENDGRRFFGCQNYMFGKSCGYFCWDDPEIPAYCQKTIKRLQHNVDKLKVEVEKIQASRDIQSLNHRLEIEAQEATGEGYLRSNNFIVVAILFWDTFIQLWLVERKMFHLVLEVSN